MEERIRILQVTAVDTTVRFLLLPLIGRLEDEGFEVHVACSHGPYVDELRGRGIPVHVIPIARRIVAWSHLRSLAHLVRLLRRERFNVVHVHTPVASVLGRIAARFVRAPHVVYTAHGFYFHDRMARWKRRLLVGVERLMGRCCTDLLLSQSAEDCDTAVRERIVPAGKAKWIGNGVNVDRFALVPDPSLRERLGLEPDCEVVGFVGRLVGEKGVWELLDALAMLAPTRPALRLLVVGDTLESDRDRRTGNSLPHTIKTYGLQERIVFAGFQKDTSPYYALMSLFVLPSHREGMPRTILEAMAAGLPVIATNIRGCREEVIPEETGLLVPVGDAERLARAIERVLDDREGARRMGEAGRSRVAKHFREEQVLDRQVACLRRLLGG